MPKKKQLNREIEIKKYGKDAWLFNIYGEVPVLDKRGKPSKNAGEIVVMETRYPGPVPQLAKSLLEYCLNDHELKLTLKEKKEMEAMAIQLRDYLEVVVNKAADRVIEALNDKIFEITKVK